MLQRQIWGGTYRKLWSGDTELFEALLLSLDGESRYLRFGHQVCDKWIKNYAKKALDKNCLVWGYVGTDGELLGCAEMRRFNHEGSPCAEVAFAVKKQAQGQGIGTQLMSRILRSAQNRSIEHLYMNCLAENEPMQRLAKHFSAQLSFNEGEVVCDLIPRPATAGTRLKEAMDDSAQLMQGVLSLSSQLFTRPGKRAA